VATERGDRYILKKVSTFSAPDPVRRFTGEARILAYLLQQGVPVAVPVLSDDGKAYTTFTWPPHRHQAALKLRRCGQGSRSNAAAWRGRTTVKWRRLRVAIRVVPRRSASVITDASVPPSRRSA
jgi:hypothetical protein